MINTNLSPIHVEYNGYQINVTDFRHTIVTWGKSNFRIFPWRLTRDPYKILIAEVMLKRTQARQVEPVYSGFLKQYPDLLSLKNISIHELQNVFGSLGLNYRVKLFHEMIAILYNEYNGIVPEGYEDLMSLPGVSYYSAGAIRCFAWNYPEALIDTNTMRIVCRIFDKPDMDSLRRNKKFMELMKLLADHESPRVYNYALLDLADKICKKLPVCTRCPLIKICKSGK